MSGIGNFDVFCLWNCRGELPHLFGRGNRVLGSGDDQCRHVDTAELRRLKFRDLFEQRSVHIIQPDINQCGGLLEVKKIAATAETYSVVVAPHNVGGIVSTTAALHLMATLRNGKILEHFNDFVDESIQACGSPYPQVVDGYFQLPTGPGWGVELDMDFIRANQAKRIDGVIQDPGLNMFVDENWNRRARE